MSLGTYATTIACPKVLLPRLSSTPRCSSHTPRQSVVYQSGTTDPHLLTGSTQCSGEAEMPHCETRHCRAHPGACGFPDSAALLFSWRKAERDETWR